MKVVGYISTTAFTIVYGAIMNGWALTKLWHWFVEGQFGLKPLSIPAAMGLVLVVGYLTHQIDTAKKEKDDDSYAVQLIRTFAIATLKPLMALLVGSIVKAWL